MLKEKYKDKEIDVILKEIVIIVDSRERVNFHIINYFDGNNIKWVKQKLDFGDYSFMIPRILALDILEDICFDDEIAIERKANAEEISGNLTDGRERFKREFERGNGKVRLLIEDSNYTDISNGNYNTKMNPKSFIGSLHSIQEKYNAPFFFINKEHSGEYIYNTFKYYIRNKLKNK